MNHIGKYLGMRNALMGVVLGALSAAAPASAQPVADKYPDKPIKIIVPFAPGGSTDIIARVIGQKMTESWGQTVVVETRPGAATIIGTQAAANADPDGHTLLITVSNHATNPSLRDKMPYDAIADFEYVSMVTRIPLIPYTNPKFEPKDLKELIAHAKANPGKLNFGSSGTAGLQHFAGELFAHMAGINIVHVPYKGTAAVIPAMLAGDVQLGFGTLFGVRPHLPSGRLKALAVTTGKRTPAAPELPTVSEAGLPGYEVDQWYGVLTGAKVPAPIVKKLNAGINEALKSPEVVKRFAADGSTPKGSTPQEFRAHVASEIVKWRKLVKAAGLKLEQ